MQRGIKRATLVAGFNLHLANICWLLAQTKWKESLSAISVRFKTSAMSLHCLKLLKQVSTLFLNWPKWGRLSKRMAAVSRKSCRLKSIWVRNLSTIMSLSVQLRRSQQLVLIHHSCWAADMLSASRLCTGLIGMRGLSSSAIPAQPKWHEMKLKKSHSTPSYQIQYERCTWLYRTEYDKPNL